MHKLVGLIGLTALAAACACAGWDGEEPSPVVARGGGIAITLAELDDWVKQSLFEESTDGGEPSQLYEVRARALDSLIEQRVVAAEAERRGSSVESLLASAGSGVSDEQVRAFFDEHPQDMREQPFEQVAPFIRTHLERIERRQAVAAWIEQAGVRVELEPPRFEVAAEGPSRGPADARVTIVEFSDFQCPYCRRAGPIVEELLARYPDDVRIVYRHLPLESIHPRARPAARASICLEQQGLFWEFHDALFAGPNPLADADLRQLAEGVGADLEAYAACLASGEQDARIDADVAAARELGISGTPAFLVNGVMLRGAQPVPAFERIIERELALDRAAP
jgi:protein-disulfide isomerase